MALADFIPEAFRAKPVGGHGPTSPRVSGVSDEAITPVPEHYAGHVLPGGRGTELHGIPPQQDYTDPRGEFEHSVAVEHVEHPHPPTPILVKVVNNDGNEVADWRSFSTIADGTPRMIITRMDTRTTVRIHNTDASKAIYIGRDSSVSASNGFPVLAGAVPLVLNSTRPVWAVSVDGSSVDVRVLLEFRKH